MGLFSSLFRGSTKNKAPGDVGFFSSYGSSLGSTGNLSTMDIYKSWVYACDRAISQEVSKIDLVLLQKNAKTGENKIVENSKAMDLLLRPNHIMTKQTLFSRLQSHKELLGNEYWRIIKVRNQPEVIVPLRPNMVEPIPAKKGFIKGYKLTLNGQITIIPNNEIVHFKNFHPLSDLIGLSTLSAARDAAMTDLSARKYNQEFFDNGARPGVILKSKSSLASSKKKEIVAAWNRLYSGQGRKYKTAIADGGLDIEEFSSNQKDMEFMDQRKFSRDEIMAIFGVPRLILGIVEDVNRATAEASMFVFAKQTIEPKLRAIVDTLNAFYLPMFADTKDQFFEFITPIPKDKTALVKEYQSGIAGGWLTPNEVRAAEGLLPLADGDNTYLPLNLAPLSNPLKKSYDPEVLQQDTAVKSLLSSLKEILPANKVEDPDKEGVKLPKVVLMTPDKERFGEVKSAQERKRLLKQEALYAKKIQKLFKRQQKTIIKNLVEAFKGKSEIAQKAEGDDKVKPDDVQEPINKEKEVAKTIALLTPLMLTTIKIEGDLALDIVGSDATLTLNSQASSKFVAKRVAKVANRMTDFTIAEMQRIITEGLNAGDAIPGLAKRVREATVFNKFRSEKIARTEVFRMKTQGELEGWKKSGVVDGKIWFTALDERVCPACVPLHGKEIELGEQFQKLGAVDGAGRVVSFEPIVGAPQHPQCRCTLLPVTKTRSAD